MAKLFQLLLILFAIYVAVRLLVALLASLSGGRYRAYRHLASRYRGRYESRGLVDPPTVSFRHGNSMVRVGLAPVVPGQPNPPRTRIVTRFSDGQPFRMELFPALRRSPPQIPRGTRPIRPIEPTFDRDYVVRANDAEVTRSLLTDPQVRQTLEGLRRLSPPGGLLFTTNPERMLVQVDRDLGTNVQHLDQVVRLVLGFHDLLLEHVASRAADGISIVDASASEPETVGPAICKVCGESIEGPHVVCQTCRSPHHHDCWSFVGGCSIYGCKGRQAEPISVSVPEHP